MEEQNDSGHVALGPDPTDSVPGSGCLGARVMPRERSAETVPVCAPETPPPGSACPLNRDVPARYAFGKDEGSIMGLQR